MEVCRVCKFCNSNIEKVPTKRRNSILPSENELFRLVRTVLAELYSEDQEIFDANISYAQVCRRCALEFQHSSDFIEMCRRGQANIRNKSIDQPLDHPKYRRLPVQSKKTPSKKQKSKTSIQSPQQQYNTTASIDANDQQSQQSSLHLVHPDMEPSSVNHTNASTSSEFVHMESSEERMTDESWGIVARARNRNESEQPIDSLVEQPTPYQLLLPSMQRDITRPESEQSLMVSESSRTDDVQMNIERSMWSRANGSQMSRLCLSVEEELRQPQINSDPQTVELMSDGEQLIESRKKKTIDSFIRLLQSPGKVVIRKRQASFEERERIKSQANCLIIQS